MAKLYRHIEERAAWIGPRIQQQTDWIYRLNDAQIADIVAYTRRRYAPDLPAWTALNEQVRRLR